MRNYLNSICAFLLLPHYRPKSKATSGPEYRKCPEMPHQREFGTVKALDHLLQRFSVVYKVSI